MIKKICLLTFVGLFLSSNAFAVPDENLDEMSDKKSCLSFAKEDGTPKEAMEEYMQQCLAQMQESEDQYEEVNDATDFDEEIIYESDEGYDQSPDVITPKLRKE